MNIQTYIIVPFNKHVTTCITLEIKIEIHEKPKWYNENQNILLQKILIYEKIKMRNEKEHRWNKDATK